MDLFQPASNLDVTTSYGALPPTYAGSPMGYQQIPSVYSTPPPSYGQQSGGLYLPPGLTDYTVQQQPVPTLQVAKGYKWTESAPIIVYLALAIAGLVLVVFTPGSAKAKVLHLVLAILWVVIWGIFVILAAKKGKTALAWILAIVPIVLWLIFQILIFIRAISINV